MNIRYAIDGATRRNGQPDCVAAGAVVCQILNGSAPQYQRIMTVHEYGSTNQRGEMLALLEAITHFCSSDFNECQIITDSEYLFNTIHNDWLTKWSGTWTTSKGEPVKNRDIWELILQLIQSTDKTINIYHIKGHIIPMGKATVSSLIEKDDNGVSLYKACVDKFKSYKIKDEKLANLQELSVKNNGFELTDEVIRVFVTMNTTADAIAGYVADKADAAR